MLFSPSLLLLSLSSLPLSFCLPTTSTTPNATPGKVPTIWQGGKFRGAFLLGSQLSAEYLTLDTGSTPFWTRWTGQQSDPTYLSNLSGLYKFTCPTTPPDCSTITPTGGNAVCCASGWRVQYGAAGSGNYNTITGLYRTFDTVKAPAVAFPDGADLTTVNAPGSNTVSSPGAFSVGDQEIRLVNTDSRTDTARGAGIAGLGFAPKTSAKTLWENNGFGFFTSHVPNSLPQSEWYFGFGVDDASKRAGELSYVALNGPASTYWRVNVSSPITVDGSAIPLAQTILLDTGTPSTTLDATAVKAVYAKLRGGTCVAAGCVFNCSYYSAPDPVTNTLPRLPTIELPWDGTNYITMDMSAGSFYDAADKNKAYCMGALQPSPDYAAHGTYGTAVYKSAYFLWDGKNARVGMAPYASASTPSKPVVTPNGTPTTTPSAAVFPVKTVSKAFTVPILGSAQLKIVLNNDGSLDAEIPVGVGWTEESEVAGLQSLSLNPNKGTGSLLYVSLNSSGAVTQSKIVRGF